MSCCLSCSEIHTPSKSLEHSKRLNGFNKCTPEQLRMKLVQYFPDHVLSSHQCTGKCDAFQLAENLERNPGNLVMVSDFVERKRHEKIPLPDSEVAKDMYIRICGLDGTIYSGERYMLDSWEKLYLPEPITMKVFGVLESPKAMAPFPQWVVLLGEDTHVYGYEDETLHLLANNLKELLRDGIKNTETYYEYPDDLSDEDEEVLQKCKEVQKIRQKTRQFIDEDADDFNEFLSLF